MSIQIHNKGKKLLHLIEDKNGKTVGYAQDYQDALIKARTIELQMYAAGVKACGSGLPCPEDESEAFCAGYNDLMDYQKSISCGEVK